MATTLYPSAVDRALTSGLGLTTGTVSATLVAKTATYNPAHTVLSDISAGDREATVALANRSVSGGVFDADPAVFESVSGDPVGAIVIDRDGDLVAWLEDFGAGDGNTTLTLNGSDITATWGANGIVKATA